MANKKTLKVKIDKNFFLKVLKEKDFSLRKLGTDEAYNYIQRTERTIRRCLDQGEMPPEILDRIASFLNVHPDYLSGAENQRIRKIEDSYFRFREKHRLKAENYPYFLESYKKINYEKNFKDLLVLHRISEELFQSLPPIERYYFRQEIDLAIERVIEKHFSTDALGNATEDQLSYLESYLHDYDPDSYYAYLEGIGIALEE